MIDWSTVSPMLKTLFASLALDTAPVPGFPAEWFDGPRSQVHTQVRKELTLRVTSVTEEGQDERRYENVDVSGQTMLQEQIVGHRRFVLQVRVDSYDHDPDNNRWAWSMIERIRTRIKRAASVATLEAANVALVGTGPAIDASFKFDQHIVNAAVCDFTFYAAFTDTDPVPQGWIEFVELTAQVSGEDGNLLPEPPNFTDVTVPPAS